MSETLEERVKRLPPGACLGCTRPDCDDDEDPRGMSSNELTGMLTITPRQPTFYHGYPGVLCSLCRGIVPSQQTHSLASLSAVFTADTLLAAGTEHQRLQAKSELQARARALSILDASVSALIMSDTLFRDLSAALEQGVRAWPQDRAAALTAACLDELELRCFLSAGQAAHLMMIMNAPECVHELCHRVVDRWNIARDIGSVGMPNCDYGMYWHDANGRAQIERCAARSTPLECRPLVLTQIYMEGERGLDVARARVGPTAIFAARILRRDRYEASDRSRQMQSPHLCTQ